MSATETPKKRRCHRTIYDRKCLLPECGKLFTANHGGARYCSTSCAGRGKRRGYVLNDQTVYLMGPKHPLIATDTAGIFRRAVDAACDGVSGPDLVDRFGGEVAKRAIEEAMKRGFRVRIKGHNGLNLLPLGIPA